MKKSLNRTIKNVIMALMIAVLCAGSYFTMDYAKNHIESTSAQVEMQMPFGDMQGGFPGGSSESSDSTNSSESSDSNSSNSSNQPPSMPSDGDSGNSSSQPPSPPGNSDGSSSSNPPTPPGSSEGNSGDSAKQPPSLPDAADSSNSSERAQSSDSSESSTQTKSKGKHSSDSSDSSKSFSKGNMKGFGRSTKKLTTIYYVLFGCESLLIAIILIYLIMSHFNKKSFKETFKSSDKILIYALSLIIATSALTAAQSTVANKVFLNSSSSSQSIDMNNRSSSSTASATGLTTVDGKEETLSSSYSSKEADQSAILVTNSGNATINGATIEKTGDTTNTENSEFYGVNSGILVQANSTATIKDATITTDAKGANAVFSTGENSKIYISDSTITTTGESSSRGLDATYGGYIEADNVTITTQGGSCATLATDRGEGTVTVKNSKLETNGAGSPVIYSTGNISIENTTGTANGAQNVVIEGKNSATLTNSALSATGAGNRGDVDRAGVMIYQSMSGDASEGTGTFTAENSSLSILKDSKYYTSAPMFFVTNTDAVINLNNTRLSFGSGVLINAAGTSEWGNEGSNGGNVTLNATSQTLKGNIVADKLSTVSINLTKSTYEGTINGENTAGEVSLKLDKDSKITLTGDCYVSSLENADTSNSNINFNGYKLYVNGKAIN